MPSYMTSSGHGGSASSLTQISKGNEGGDAKLTTKPRTGVCVCVCCVCVVCVCVCVCVFVFLLGRPTASCCALILCWLMLGSLLPWAALMMSCPLLSGSSGCSPCCRERSGSLRWPPLQMISIVPRISSGHDMHRVSPPPPPLPPPIPRLIFLSDIVSQPWLCPSIWPVACWMDTASSSFRPRVSHPWRFPPATAVSHGDGHRFKSLTLFSALRL